MRCKKCGSQMERVVSSYGKISWHCTRMGCYGIVCGISVRDVGVRLHGVGFQERMKSARKRTKVSNLCSVSAFIADSFRCAVLGTFRRILRVFGFGENR